MWCPRVIIPSVKTHIRSEDRVLFITMHLTHDLDLFPDHKVTQILFKDVKNAAELRQSAMAGKIKGALINPTMVRFFLRPQPSLIKYCCTCCVYPLASALILWPRDYNCSYHL